MPKLKNLIGQRFGRLTVIERAENNKNGHVCWKCRCDCGVKIVVDGGSLRNGDTKSCGCLKIEKASGRLFRHGLRRSRIYKIWANMKTRCFNPNNSKYPRYGGRGITVYPAWIDDFQAFYDYVSKLEHFGEKGYSLDRIDNNGNYEPENLRWANAKTQRCNQQDALMVVLYNNKKVVLKDAARLSGINYNTLYSRYCRGDMEEKLFRPVRN